MSAWRALARRWLALPPPRCEVATSSEWVALSDGTRLATRIARPAREKARGTLLLRGAGPAHAPRRPLAWVAALLAEQGLAVAVQECRGLHASEGRFTPFANEVDDGADAIAWLSRQAWFAPPLQLAGFGYAGYAAYAALARSPVPVERLLVGYAASDPFAWLHAGGALQLEATFALAFSLACAERGARGEPDLDRALRHRPLAEADRVGLRRIDWLREWLAHPQRDAFWDAREAKLPKQPPHALLLGAWRHPALAAQLADHAALAAAREGAAELVVGTGDAASRLDAVRRRLEALRTAVRFLLPEEGVRRAPVYLWDVGAARWRESPAWPPPRVATRRLHLRGEGGAQGADGDGRLDAEPPGAQEPADRFVCDPADLTPSDDGSRAWRGDVLCFATAPLPEPLQLAGPVRAELQVASDASATNFCARLVAIDAAGAETPICEGIARASGPAAAPSEPRFVVVECGAACFRVGSGARLRLEISSASHPRFDCAADVPARQTLFHDAAHASSLLVEVEAGK